MECDYPVEVDRLPNLTRSNIPPGLSSEQIDTLVSATLDATGSLYEWDLLLLEALQPDIILTQRLPVGMTGWILADFQEAPEITYLVHGEPPVLRKNSVRHKILPDVTLRRRPDPSERCLCDPYRCLSRCVACEPSYELASTY